MNILFLSCAYSEPQKGLFQTKSKYGYQYAAQNFQEAILDGVLKKTEVNFTILSIPTLSTFPRGSRILWVKDTPFIFNGNKIGESFGFVNLPLCNHLHQSRIDKYIDQWYYSVSGEKRIVVYAMLKMQMQYAVLAKRRHPDIKLCLIIPDLPIYMNCNKYYKMLGLQKRNLKVINTLQHLFDYYVVLAEPMVQQLNIVDKPYVVIEGIYINESPVYEHVEKFRNPTILYAGGIQTRYGVFDLIEAFRRINNKDYRLILCGPCLEMEKLNYYLCSDSRIEYRGLIPTDTVRKLQKEVTLLVNPRHSSEEFTKYSFPSKTIEYMASGTPVLMSSLPSMPEEYKKYLFLFNNESIDGMKQQIEHIFTLDISDLNNMGMRAKAFIYNYKNSHIQIQKFLNLIK